MEAQETIIPRSLKRWVEKEKGPVESEVFNLTTGIGRVFSSTWYVVRALGALAFSLYCWVAVARTTPKLKPWVAFTIELAVFFILAMIPITNLYVDKVKMKDKYSYDSYTKEAKYEQNLLKVEAESYTRGMEDAKGSLIREGWVKIKD